MPTYPLSIGYSAEWAQGDNATQYWPVIGDMDVTTTEAYVQLRARDSYTWANFAIRCTYNDLTNACTAISRVNGVNGNMLISIPAATTGLFQDAVNSDALVSGTLFNFRLVTASGGAQIKFTTWASTLTTVSNTTPIINVCFPPSSTEYEDGTTYYFTIVGILRNESTEANVQYRSRVASTLSRLHTYIATNTLNVICTIRPRFNGANGNLVCSIGAGTTGLFEDAVNSDAVVATDLINHRLTSPSGSGSIYPSFISFQSNSSGQWIGAGYGNPPSQLGDGLTRYQVIQGNSNVFNGVELETQMLVQTIGTARNMMLRTNLNSLNNTTIVRTRVNGGNGNLSVSIPNATTGTFEDTVNSDSLVAADSWNWHFDTEASTAGAIEFSIVALQFDPPSGWTGKISGITNPAKIMGIDVANIAKVKGIA